MKNPNFALCIALAVISLPGRADIISGTVSDSLTNAAIPQVSVSLGTTPPITVLTDVNGAFSLNTTLRAADFQSEKRRTAPDILWDARTGTFSRGAHDGEVTLRIHTIRGAAVSSQARGGISPLPQGVYAGTAAFGNRTSAFTLLSCQAPGLSRCRIAGMHDIAPSDPLARRGAAANVLTFTKAGYVTTTKSVAGSQSNLLVKMLPATGNSLAGMTGPGFPAATPAFTVTDTTVTGAGASVAGTSDYFYGAAGVAYSVTIAAGARLYGFGDNTLPGAYALTNPASPLNTPNGEVIAFTTGTLVNNGILATYPLAPNVAANNYKQVAAVVYIDSKAAAPAVIINNGRIGVQLTGSFGVVDSLSGYGQFNAAGIYTSGPATITNNAGALITGYNAVFTNGAGTLDNYGLINAINDGVLSGFTVNNYQGAGITTCTQGFACIHSYGDVNNWGYMIGSDYGMLVEGAHVINDYGGPLVANVKNIDGSAVYNGEVSSLCRGAPGPNDTGPYLSCDAFMVDGNGATVNLISRKIDTTLYLPLIVGPIVGGFNGTFASATAHQSNTLNFQLDGLSAADAATLQAAVTASLRTGSSGSYYSGTVTVAGRYYHWEDFAHVQYLGKNL